MVAKAVPELKDEAKRLWEETNESNLIFVTIVKKSRKKKGQEITLDIRHLKIRNFIRN